MAKMSLIEMVQDILSDLNSDEVNSISDTIESLQVAQIVKSVFFEMIANKNWPHLRKLSTLQASNDISHPTHMKVRDNVKELEWIEYNKRTVEAPLRNKYEPLKYLAPDQFLALVSKRDNTLDNVEEISDFSGIKLHIFNDKHPVYYTSFDDDWIVCDGYIKTLESTLQEVNSRISVYEEPSWQMDDGFIPDLPSEAFPALLAEAKSTSFVRIKQMPDQKAEQQSVRQRNWLSRKAWKVKGGIVLPNYARRSRK